MCRLDMDDQFYDTAMSFFIEAGHITTREPEYFNLSTDQIIMVKDDYDDALLKCFENLSLLFVIRQCMFFSAELLCDCKHRSQMAHDVHGLIHSLIEMDASVCVFRCDDEMLISFLGYGCNCVLSDWYPIEDRDGLLAEKLDISNVSTQSNYAYFRDLMYSLEREYYRIREEKTIYPVFPTDCIRKVEMGEYSIAEVTRMIHDSLEKEFLEYGDDYVPYRASDKVLMPDITRELNIMLHVPTDAGENPFGEKVETDDEDDDFFADDNPEERKIVSSRVSSQSPNVLSSRSSKYNSEYIWVGSELVRRRTAAPVPEFAWVNGKLVNREMKKPIMESGTQGVQKSIDSLSRKGDTVRQHYMAVVQEKGKVNFSIFSDFGKSWEAKRDPEDQSIEDEILLVLDMMGCPIEFADLKQRSRILSDTDDDVLNSLLYKLCLIHKVCRVWVQASRRYFYCVDTPVMRHEILLKSQKQIELQNAMKVTAFKKEKQEMKKKVGRPRKQAVAQKTVVKGKTKKGKCVWYK